MNRICYLSIVFLFACKTLYSQNFLADNSKWEYSGVYYGSPSILTAKDSTLFVDYFGDTILENINYKKFKISALPCSYGSDLVYYLSESDKRVYYQFDLKETAILAYDFNKNIGETWISQTSPTSYFKVQVDSISNLELNGKSLKRMHLTYFYYEEYPLNSGEYILFGTYCSTANERTLDETFFINYKLFGVADCPMEIDIKKLEKYSDNEIEFSSSNLYSDCVKKVLSVDRKREGYSNFFCYPTISSKEIEIGGIDNFQNPRVQLINTNGLGKEMKLDSNNRLDISTLNDGMYFLYLYDSEQLITTLKFIKE